MPVVSSTQMTLNFEPDKYRQFGTLKEFMREQAIPALFQLKGIPKKHIAADMDISPSELTRKLSENPNDPRNLSTDDLEDYLRTQGDLEPVYYLLSKYGPADDELSRLKARVAELEAEPSVKAAS